MTEFKGLHVDADGLLVGSARWAYGFHDVPEHECLGRFSSSSSRAKQPGNAEAGRSVFNGKGVCYYCHGMDGIADQLTATRSRHRRAHRAAQSATSRSQKSEEPPVNHRQGACKGDPGRTPGTGMFPDTTMTDQELTDTLAYLALLRSEGSAKRK